MGATVRAQYQFDSFTTDNGLPQNGVRGIAQTPDGYLWFTTFDGLVRYDGAKFAVFDKSNSPGILSNRFFLLHAEPDGTLFAGTEDGGLTVYRSNAFKTYTVADGLPSNQLVDFPSNARGEFYIQTATGRCYFRKGEFVRVPDADVPNENRFYKAPSGSVWTFGANGIRQIAPDREQLFYSIKIKAYNEKLTGLKLFEDRAGNLWFGDLNGVYRLRGGAVTKFTAADGVPPGVCLLPYTEENDGSIWFASGVPWLAGVGAVRFKDGRFTTWGKSAGLSSLLIDEIFRDREGTIWVTTTDRGINRLQKQIVKPLSVADGLIHTEAYPLLETRDGTIYVGTTQGLSRMTKDERFADALAENSEGVKISVTALYEDAAGRLWVGSTNGNLFRLENGVWRRILLADNRTIWTINNDLNGNVWLGTDKGLLVFRDDRLIAKYTTADGLPSDDVKIIYRSRDGSLWFGTYGGLVKSEPPAAAGGLSGGINRPLPQAALTSFTTADGLASNRVRAIYEDASGTFWIGTYDGGLSRLKNGKIFSYAIENGLFSNGVFQILEDRLENFWISSNRGIYRVSKQELNDFANGKVSKINSVAYGKADGMLSTECNGGRQPAGIAASDGKFWFPTQDGVVVVSPDEVSYNSIPPPVEIESVLVERQPVDFQNGVRLGAGGDNLEIRYTGISFVKPEQVKFRYRIEGLDENWTDVRTIREVYFPSLPAGEYTFHVVAANSDGVWNPEGARLKILVLAPFWRTSWFVVLCALAAVAVIFSVFRLRERELKRRQRVQQEFGRRLLDSQERERKRIAAEMHDSLGQYLLAIKNWAMFGLNSLPPESAAREYLTEVSETSALAIAEVREIAHNLRPYQLERLGLTNTLEYMLKQIRTAAGIEFDFEIENVDGVLPPEAEIVFYRIVQESVSNVVKHSRAQNAFVSIEKNNDRLRFVCRDDGAGFDVDAAKNSPASGLGLTGLAERVKILHGECEINSEIGGGTIVSITIPTKG